MIGKFLLWTVAFFGLLLIMSYDFTLGMLVGLLAPIVIIFVGYFGGAIKTYLYYKRNPRESILIGRMDPITHEIIWH